MSQESNANLPKSHPGVIVYAHIEPTGLLNPDQIGEAMQNVDKIIQGILEQFPNTHKGQTNSNTTLRFRASEIEFTIERRTGANQADDPDGNAIEG
jgi:hypothetical protein